MGGPVITVKAKEPSADSDPLPHRDKKGNWILPKWIAAILSAILIAAGGWIGKTAVGTYQKVQYDDGVIQALPQKFDELKDADHKNADQFQKLADQAQKTAEFAAWTAGSLNAFMARIGMEPPKPLPALTVAPATTGP